jgi:cystathionine beta-lyase/cystathionine gamma-synthase
MQDFPFLLQQLQGVARLGSDSLRGAAVAAELGPLSNPEGQDGAVNPPVYHASTILSSNVAEWEAKRAPKMRFDMVRYGLLGTPTTFALEEALASLEGGYRAMLMSSGLAAITAPLQACLKCGDHLLMVDSAYGPARNFCERVLTRCGIATTYYDPLIGAEIARLMRPNTKVVYVESPGSLTFEVQDVPAIAAAAHEAGAKVLGQHLGFALSLSLIRAWGRCLDPCSDQIHRRPFRRDPRSRNHQRGDLPEGSHHGG